MSPTAAANTGYHSLRPTAQVTWQFRRHRVTFHDGDAQRSRAERWKIERGRSAQSVRGEGGREGNRDKATQFNATSLSSPSHVASPMHYQLQIRPSSS